MRILFSTFPAFGHFHPVVPLALAAQAAGHDVRVATGPNLAAWARHCGLDATPVGLSEEAAATIADRDHPGPDRTAHMFTDVWVPAALQDLLALSGSWRPDAVVHEEEEYAGVLLAGVLGVPCVTQSWSSPARPGHAQEFATRVLTPLWERHAPGTAARRVGQLYLDACPPAFQTDDIAEIARTTRIVNVRPGFYDGPPSTTPALLANLPRPAAYVTLGTVAVFSTPQLLHDLAAALAPLFAAVVVAAGPNPVEALAGLPSNVHPIAYVPQSLVLPHVDLVASHGGAGGTIGALMHGLPHLVLPGRGQSQITIGEALQRVGAGIRLGESERDARHILAAAQRLVSEPGFAVAAAGVREELDVLPGPQDALDLVEALID